MHYFETAVQQPAACGIPHLAVRRSPELADYTGIVRISGRRDGVVLFTAPRSMLCVMLMCMQDTDLSHERLRELVGEIANTLSGAAQRSLRGMRIGWVLVWLHIWKTRQPTSRYQNVEAYLEHVGFRFDYQADGVMVFRPRAPLK